MSVKAIPWPAEVSCWEGLCCSPLTPGKGTGNRARTACPALEMHFFLGESPSALLTSPSVAPRVSPAPPAPELPTWLEERRAQVCGRQLGALPERQALRSGPRDKVRAGYFAAACDGTCAWSLFFSRCRNRFPSHGAVFMPFWRGLYQSPKHG